MIGLRVTVDAPAKLAGAWPATPEGTVRRSASPEAALQKSEGFALFGTIDPLALPAPLSRWRDG